MFDSNIWGTVSDWAMVFVTTGTLYYLYQTLQSQMKVQEDQNKMTRAEVYRVRIAIIPKFTPAFQAPTVTKSNGKIRTLVNCRLFPDKNVKNVKLYFIQIHDKVRHDVESLEYLLGGTHYHIPCFLELDESEIRTLDNSILDIYIEYDDDLGNPYKQQISINLIIPNQIVPFVDNPRYLGT